jgi:hypothetical protein
MRDVGSADRILNEKADFWMARQGAFPESAFLRLRPGVFSVFQAKKIVIIEK